MRAPCAMVSRAEASAIRRLRHRKHRDAERLFLAEGVRIVEDVVDAGLTIRHAVTSDAIEHTERGRRLVGVLADRCTTSRVTDSALARMAATDTPQGVLVVVEQPEGAWPERGSGQSHRTVLVLDAVQDPGNFGALIRTADAFAVVAVVALGGTVDPWNAKAVRAAAGSSFRVPILQWEAGEGLSRLRDAGYRILGAETSGEPITEAYAGGATALIVGNEGAGLSAGVRAAVDALVSVPIRRETDSLNVAVAAGIMLYLLTRGT